MILRDTAQTLMQGITQSNCLVKYPRIFEGRHVSFMVTDILFTETVMIARLVKSF